MLALLIAFQYELCFFGADLPNNLKLDVFNVRVVPMHSFYSTIMNFPLASMISWRVDWLIENTDFFPQASLFKCYKTFIAENVQMLYRIHLLHE